MLKKRKVHLDALRIVAIFLVLFNHTGNNGFSMYTVTPPGTALYWFYMILAVAIKVGVPIFFMISGALLIPKEESVGEVLKKRFLHYLLVLAAAMLICYGYWRGWNFSRMSFEEYFRNLYSSYLTVACWYLYAYLGFLLMLPLLRKMARSMENREFVYIFLVYGVLMLLGMGEYLIWKGNSSLNRSFTVFFTSQNVFYPLLGYYIEERVDITRPKIMPCLLAVSVAAMALTCGMTHFHCIQIGEWRQSTSQIFFESLIFIPASAVYIGCKRFFAKHRCSDRISAVLKYISSLTFGIFLFEHIYREKTVVIFDILSPKIHNLPAALIWIFCACILGGVVTAVLKKIPIIKRMVS